MIYIRQSFLDDTTAIYKMRIFLQDWLEVNYTKLLEMYTILSSQIIHGLPNVSLFWLNNYNYQASAKSCCQREEW